MNAPASHTATPVDVLAGRARWCVVEGDCADVLRSLPDGCADALVSDPPSGIAFMGAEWDRDKGGRLQWVAWLTGILSDARRATRDGGRAIVWSLPRTSHWTGCAVEDAGWSIETTIAHLFGTGWPKGKAQTKPAQETWWLARTGKSEALNIDACRVRTGASPSIARRATAARTGNTPAGKTTPSGWERRNTAEHYTAEREGEAAGRWPPNAVFSHSPGCVCEGTRRVTATSIHGEASAVRGESVHAAGGGALNAGRVQPVRGYADPDGMESVEAWRCVEGCPVAELDRQSGTNVSSNRPRHNKARPVTASKGAESARVGLSVHGDTGGASRFFPQFPADDPDAPWSEALFRYVAKPSRGEKNEGCEALPQGAGAQVALGLASKIMRCAECRRTHGVTHSTPCVRCGGPVALDDAANDGAGRDGCRVHANTHPTVKSVALMRWLLRLVTKPGDVILDPFGGSGTTGVAALLEGRRVVLIEREPAFAAIARARCAAAEGTLPAQLDLIAATG